MTEDPLFRPEAMVAAARPHDRDALLALAPRAHTGIFWVLLVSLALVLAASAFAPVDRWVAGGVVLEGNALVIRVPAAAHADLAVGQPLVVERSGSSYRLTVASIDTTPRDTVVLLPGSAPEDLVAELRAGRNFRAAVLVGRESLLAALRPGTEP